MVKKLLHALVFLPFPLLPLVLFSQSPTMVSLLEQLQSAPNDSGRVDVINRIAFRHFELNQPDQGFQTASEALGIARQINYLIGEAEALENMAIFYDYRNEFRRAVDVYNSSLHLFQHLDDSVQMARILNHIGVIYRDIASYDSALRYFYRSRDILETIGDTAGLAGAFNGIGLVYGSWGDYQESLENFMASMRLNQSIQSSLGMSTTYCYIGMIYRKLEEHEKAEEYLNLALDLNKKYGPTRDVIDIYNELGILYKDTGRPREAIRVFEKSLNLARYYDNQRKVAECFDHLGLCYYEQGDYETALGFYQRASAIRTGLGISQGILVSNTNIARTSLRMIGSGGEGQSEKSAATRKEIFALLGNAVKMARLSMNFNDLVSVYETLILASATFKQYDDAVRYQKALLHFGDSVAGINQGRTLAELKARFERDQREQELLLLNSEQKLQESLMHRQRTEWFFYMGSGISLLLIVFGLWNRLSFVKIARNELQLSNMQIEEEKRRAEQSEGVKEQFLARMSHEIRIPLNTIMGGVNILLRKEHLAEQKKYLNAIRQSSENLVVIIDDILDLTSLEAGRIKLEEAPFSVHQEVMNAENILSFKAREKGIGFRVRLDENLPQCVIGDSTRLNQVLINLAGNGIKFTEKGSVDIAVSVISRKAETVTLRFEVSDTGIGIPADRLEKIFQSFTQADNDTTRKYGGTGLGLTISKQLVELQNGNLSVTSEPGRGSCFRFEITYRLGNDSDIVQEDGASSGQNELKDLKILVVEDDEFNIMVLTDALSTAIPGAVTDVARDGHEALRLWSSESYGIILMDIELPGMNGHEVTRAIRKTGAQGASIPIIAMTAGALQKEVEACYHSGMNEHVSKPFDADDLVLKINSLLIHQIKPEPWKET